MCVGLDHAAGVERSDLVQALGPAVRISHDQLRQRHEGKSRVPSLLEIEILDQSLLLLNANESLNQGILVDCML